MDAAHTRRTRTWWLAVSVVLTGMTPGLAATRVSIQELKEAPERLYDQTVLVECFYDKESPIWVRALPDADEWLGFFVTGRPEKALTWSGEYYNLLFAPSQMREALRTLRGGDKITVVGTVFPYHSASFDGAGIQVQQILLGWGPSATSIGQPIAPVASAAASAAVGERYTATINGTRYEGLRFHDRYNFDGIEFQVEQVE